MQYLQIIYIAISSLFIFFLLFPFLKVLLSGLFIERVKVEGDVDKLDYANVITAYRNANISKNLIQSLLKQTHDRHHIYLVADNCDISDWDIEHEKLTVLNPQPALNLKVKSIIHAVENFKRPHDYVVVYDADNIAHPKFLEEINWYANAGHRTIQGQRTAKNLDTTMACVDSLGEFYKNYVERYVSYLIGSSAVISGSGMAVETELYKSYLYSPEIEEGKKQWKKMLQEDKILQNHLLKLNERISYAWNAIVYDEKVTTADAVETQRSRWLYSYFQNFPNSTGLLWRGIRNFSWNQFLFGVITVSPPLFILLAISFLLGVVGLFLSPVVSLLMGIALFIFVANIFLTLYLSKVPTQVWKALGGVPLFVFKQATGLMKMRNPNKNFKHTEHNRDVSIDDLLKSSGE